MVGNWNTECNGGNSHSLMSVTVNNA